MSKINHSLVELEKNPSDADAINEVFRLMHTLKGMAATMEFNDLSELAHRIEDVFDDLRSGRSKATSQLMDTVFSCVDAFGAILDDLHEGKEPSVNISDYIKKIDGIVSAHNHNDKPTGPYPKIHMENIDITPEDKISLDNKVRNGFDIFKLSIRLVHDCPMKEARAFLIIIRAKQMGEIIKSIPPEEDLKEGKFGLSFTMIFSTKEDARVVKDELSRILEVENVSVEKFKYSSGIEKTSSKPSASYLKKIQSMRIPVERLDKIMNLMGELSIAKSRLIEAVQSEDLAITKETAFMIDRLVSMLQDETLQTRLLPISYILDIFPRVVRDFVRKSNKEVDLKIIGSEIELDRIILDEIGDPLMHIVRNAIDHGVEDKDERVKAGKNPKAEVLIKVSREKGHVVIEISDDGRGIDFKEIKRKAIEKGIAMENDLEGLDNKKVLDIMATPGFSTSDKITDISGRGVGLDVVKSRLDTLSGRIDFDTEIGKGTKFTLTLPLTLAIIKAMLVSAGNEVFAIPIMNIKENVVIDADTIKTIQNKEVVKVRDEIIPLIRLDKELGAHYKERDSHKLSVVIVEGRVKSLGLLVDKIVGEQDIVVKPLGAMIHKVRGIAGATILGDGKVALILDVINIV